MNLLAHPFRRLPDGLDFGDADVVCLKKVHHINGRSAFGPERLANRQNPRPFHSPGFDAPTDEVCVV